MTYLADDVAWLDITYGLQVLLHRTVIVPLTIITVAELSMYVRHTRFVQSLCLGHVQRGEVLRLSVQEV